MVEQWAREDMAPPLPRIEAANGATCIERDSSQHHAVMFMFIQAAWASVGETVAPRGEQAFEQPGEFLAQARGDTLGGRRIDSKE